MRRMLAACALGLSAVVGLSGQAAAAGSCDNLEGQDVSFAGTIDKIASIGVIFFIDKKTGCEVGLVPALSERQCRAGGQIEVKGKLRKNAYLKGTYDIERNRKAPESLVCR